MIVCKRTRYFGRVQGVGFRYTTQALARQFSVAGYVRNLDDGSVELVGEGPQESVEAFLDAVVRHMINYIEKTEATDLQPQNLQGFVIRT